MAARNGVILMPGPLPNRCDPLRIKASGTANDHTAPERPVLRLRLMISRDAPADALDDMHRAGLS